MALENGTYMIVSTLSGNSVIDLEGGNNPMAKTILYKPHGGKNQQWKATRLTGTDEYSFQSVYGGTFLTAPEDGSAQQLYSSSYDPNYNRNTRWKVVQSKGGFTIVSALNPGRAVDVSGGAVQDLTPIILWSLHGQQNQIFTFKKV